MVRVMEKASLMAKENDNIECEVIDLQTLYPYDADTLIASVKKTGRAVIIHEAPVMNHFLLIDC